MISRRHMDNWKIAKQLIHTKHNQAHKLIWNETFLVALSRFFFRLSVYLEI